MRIGRGNKRTLSFGTSSSQLDGNMAHKNRKMSKKKYKFNVGYEPGGFFLDLSHYDEDSESSIGINRKYRYCNEGETMLNKDYESIDWMP